MAFREDAHINKLRVEKLYTGSPGSWALRHLLGGVAAGYKLARGYAAGTAAASIATGLSTVVDFVATVKGNSAALANACALVTGRKSAITAGQLLLYRWKATSAGTTTLVAATTAGTLEWIAVGT
jgi:hypothetical protein